MKKFTFVIILFLNIFSIIYAENSEKKKYVGGEMFLIVLDNKTSKELNRIPFGVLQSIDYDTKTKLFFIIFTGEKGTGGFYLEYVMKKGDTLLMKDRDNYWLVKNRLDINGEFIMRSTKRNMILLIKNIKVYE